MPKTTPKPKAASSPRASAARATTARAKASPKPPPKAAKPVAKAKVAKAEPEEPKRRPGRPPSPDGTERLTINLPAPLMADLRSHATKTGDSLSGVATAALRKLVGK